jgi:hypothetical protein
VRRPRRTGVRCSTVRVGARRRSIALDAATLRFQPAHGHGEGLIGVDLVEASHAARERALATAKQRGLRVEGHAFWIAGTALRLVEAATP